MKGTFFVKASVGDNGSRISFGRKATENRGHREVTQYGCFGDGVVEDVVEKLVELLEVVAFEGDEEHPFLEGLVELEFTVTGEVEEYEVPEEFIPAGLKSITVFTTPVEITGCGEPGTALHRAASCNYDRHGVQENKKVAAKWWRKAAEYGDARAQLKLGEMYYNGEGVEQDYETAFEWYLKAAEQGDADAQNRVGVMHYNGEGVEQDYEEAFEWYLKAAKRDNSDAQYNIGAMYRDGEGVEENKDLAEEWFRKAAAYGDEDAQEALKALHAEREEEILGELDALTGLASIKEDVHRLFKVLRTQKKRHDMGLKVPEMTYHCVFSGNPGTGKTTVARILAKIYQVTGVVKTDKFVEAGREDLVAEYLGQTAIKTNALIDSAIDGVLFIDEAYSLSNGNEVNGDSYGREAIETLLRRMENDRDKLVVIVAGYTKEMRQFIDSNPGLRSRFTRFFEFPDYTADELAEIFSEMAKRNDYDVSSAVKAKIVRIVEECLRTKPKNFGNAREIRKLYEEAVARQAARVDDLPSPTEKDMRRLSVKDIPNVI